MKNRFAEPQKYRISESVNSNYKPDLTISTRADPDAQPRSLAKLLRLKAEEYPRIDVYFEDPITIGSERIMNMERDTRSPFYEVFDLSYVPVSLQYDGLALAARSKNTSYNKKWMERSLATLATLSYTQRTELAFLSSTYQTDIPQMESGDAARIGYGVFSESIVQSYYAIFGKYNTTLQLINWMQNRCWGFAEIQMTLLAGQLLRKAVQTTFRTPAEIVHDLYIDIDFAKEVNVINVSPYAANGSIEADYKSVVGSFIIPDVKAWRADQDPQSDTPYFDTSTMPEFQAIPVTLTRGNETVTTLYDFQSLTQHILELLEPANMIRICRENAAGTATESLTYYLNDLLASVKAIAGITVKVREVMMDLLIALEALDNEVGMVPWVQGLTFIDPTVHREQMNPVRYELTHHVHRGLGSAGNAVWDDAMQAWRVYSLYNKYTGIPMYELYEGGHSIAMSVRSPDTAGMSVGDMSLMFQKLFLPWIEPGEGGTTVRVNHTFINRKGDTFEVTLDEYDLTAIMANDYLAELVYGTLPGIKITIPKVSLDASTVDHVKRSQIRKAMTRAFSVCNIYYNNTDHFNADVGLELIEPRLYDTIPVKVQEFCDVRTMFPPQRGRATLGFSTQ